MKRKRFVWLGLGLAFLSIFMIASAKYGSGGCEITGFSMSPLDPYVVGDHVRLEGTSSCGTVRFEINGQPKAEIGQPNQGEWWKTEEFGAGNYDVCFVARGNTDWTNANRSCRRVYVEGGQAPPPGSNPAGTAKCWINTFTVSPGSVPEGEVVHLSGQGQCDGNARATRFTINGTPYDEFGGYQNDYNYRTAGAGTFLACMQLTAGNWEGDAAESCVNFTVTSNGSSSSTEVLQGDQSTNNKPGQTSQSGPDGSNPSSNGETSSGSCDNPTYYSRDYFGGWSEPGSGDWAYVPGDIDVLRLRVGKSCDSAVYGYVSPNDWYPVINENAAYVKIRTQNGTVGWIMKSYVRVDHNRQAPYVQPPAPTGEPNQATQAITPLETVPKNEIQDGSNNGGVEVQGTTENDICTTTAKSRFSPTRGWYVLEIPISPSSKLVKITFDGSLVANADIGIRHDGYATPFTENTIVLGISTRWAWSHFLWFKDSLWEVYYVCK